uniref:ATP synthase F0 subunit 8 n=1 Tax=Questa ersei TaxID=645998 RepID=C4NTU1_9ANNE|nr:ATP synthase F0 subunit 8 [Questa ersei]
MPHLSPLNWLLLPPLFWLILSSLLSSFWWAQTTSFPMRVPKSTPPQLMWPWSY